MADSQTTPECPDCGVEIRKANDGATRCPYCNSWAFRDAVSDGAIYAAASKTTMAPARYEAILAQQKLDWPKHIAGAKDGNPFATLCEHCYGRHAPPKDEICPHSPPPKRQ